MATETEQFYLDKIPQQYRDKPKITGHIQSLIAPLCKVIDTANAIKSVMDVDSASGDLLDKLGEWVGAFRKVSVPISDVYFKWEGTQAEGWNQGIWAGSGVSGSDVVELPDSTFRKLIKFKIAANSWDGSIGGIYDIANEVFPGELLIIPDDGIGDMGLSLTIVGELTTADIGMLNAGLSSLKSVAVDVDYSFIIGPPKVFGFGEDDYYGGLGESSFI